MRMIAAACLILLCAASFVHADEVPLKDIRAAIAPRVKLILECQKPSGRFGLAPADFRGKAPVRRNKDADHSAGQHSLGDFVIVQLPRLASGQADGRKGRTGTGGRRRYDHTHGTLDFHQCRRQQHHPIEDSGVEQPTANQRVLIATGLKAQNSVLVLGSIESLKNTSFSS